ncbi:MAG: response regulator [Pseudomonadota bacterium]
MSEPSDTHLPLRAVVADDDVDIRRVIAIQLKELGYEVIEAGNGDAVKAAVTEHPPDLICLDLNMPLVSGYAVLRWLREEPALTEIPVLVITARTSLDDYATCREYQATAIVEKPFRTKALRAAVQRLVGQSGAAAATAPRSRSGDSGEKP